jgi:hypothetical protein
VPKVEPVIGSSAPKTEQVVSSSAPKVEPVIGSSAPKTEQVVSSSAPKVEPVIGSSAPKTEQVVSSSAPKVKAPNKTIPSDGSYTPYLIGGGIAAAGGAGYLLHRRNKNK